MGDGGGEAAAAAAAAAAANGGEGNGASTAALHVIVLGSGGGPLESNVTALLVRSVESGWRRGSIVALDAGVHLGAIANILKETQPAGLGESEELSLPHTLTSGPFAGLSVPYRNPNANASHIHQNLIDTYLITHPHLDHISAFVINTAGLTGGRPKRLAGLPSTIAAFKTHIFNNVIWPNLSDENNGAGLVTYMRLVEGGSPAFGEGEGKGYLEISDGLSVKIWGVSHGHCIERHTHRGSGSSVRHGSFDASSFGMGAVGMGMSLLSPRTNGPHHSSSSSLGVFMQQQQSQQAREQQSPSQTGPGVPRPGSVSGPGTASESVCVYDSSAYFLRHVTTGREIIVFGDVEPDSISLSPRNKLVWAEAAPKIVSGKLAAIFIECSFDDSQSVDRLFGHLSPRFIAEEMRSLAAEVGAEREAIRLKERERLSSTASGYGSGSEKKRKRQGSDVGALLTRRKTGQGASSTTGRTYGGVTSNPVPGPPGLHHAESEDSPVSPKTVKPNGSVAAHRPEGTESPHLATPTAELSLHDVEMMTPLGFRGGPGPLEDGVESELPLPLQGLKIVIIHVKDKLNEGPAAGDVILEQLRAHEAEDMLGCEYILSSVGQDLYL
ncbi:cAMP phosphodiesterases class-II-domain-containing protein [Echria macrotheca]|uniref:cAMP phosphodiesterases class-II-domain-containing protein n=1 Tax=Echria macrotheca TaxID=438768 RepID=A0AAJ0BDG5_9PEZI|nr:cAMP phosphodiesterases class-II-domain-containing protein [Echria macrotheca]